MEPEILGCGARKIFGVIKKRSPSAALSIGHAWQCLLRVLLRVVLYTLPAGVISVQAAPVNFVLSGTVSNADAGNAYGLSATDQIFANGSYDDAGLTGVGNETLLLNVGGGSLLMTVGSATFTELDDATPGLMFVDGVVIGLNFLAPFDGLGTFTSNGNYFWGNDGSSGNGGFGLDVEGYWDSYATVDPGAAGYQLAADIAAVWLEQNQNSDGSWGADEAIQTLLTVDAVLALKVIQGRNVAYYQGITWLENHQSVNVDAVARRIIALAPHGDDVTYGAQYLVDTQRLTVPSNSGWGLSAGYGGSPIDTALALLANEQLGVTANVQIALDYLKNSQLTGTDQGWPVVEGGTTDPMTTAMVVQSLVVHLGQDPSLSTNISNAVSTLGNLVSASDSALTRAHTALALLRADPTSTTARTLLNSLVSNQLPDGSWGSDVYTTVISIRAMAAVLGFDSAALDNRITIPDANLRAAINLSLGRNLVDSLSVREIAALTSLIAPGMGISDLTGLEAAINLTSIDLSNNQITDLSPLASNAGLTQVALSGNPLSDAVDTDGDGVGDLTEANAGTNPFSADVDTDGDGIVDSIDPYPSIPADGDLNSDGLVNVADVLIATQIVLGTRLPDTYFGHGDVAPLVGGVPSPNGVIDLGDLLVIQRKALGLINF